MLLPGQRDLTDVTYRHDQATASLPLCPPSALESVVLGVHFCFALCTTLPTREGVCKQACVNSCSPKGGSTVIRVG